MSIFAPNSDIVLIAAPLTFGDANQIDFANIAAQTAYFNNLGAAGLRLTDCTYQRKDSYIRVPVLAENLYHYNYCYYDNFEGKRIYAYITRVEFVNQNCSNVYIKTDVFQTWQFNFTFKQCTVIREHTATDRPYEHTLPENIETGEAVEIYRTRATTFDVRGDTATDFDANFKVVFCMSEELKNAGIAQITPQMCGGVPAAARYYAVNRTAVRDMIDKITTEGQADAIISVYACPDVPGRNVFIDLQATTSFSIYSVNDTAETEVSVIPPKGYYVPRTYSGTPFAIFQNRKCLCYPYHFFRLWTSDGQSVDLRTENFRNISTNPGTLEEITIRTTLNPAQDVSTISAPENYLFENAGNNTAHGANYAYAVTFNGFPEIAWSTDVFKDYLARNKSSVRATMFNTATQTAFGLLQGTLSGLQAADAMSTAVEGLDVSAGVGAAKQFSSAGAQIYGAIGNAWAAYANFKDLQRIPDRLRGLASVGAIMQTGAPGVYISEMCIRPEYLAAVDEFFTRYGYLVQKLKTPTYKGRNNHNYLQTADCDIIANIPNDDAAELRAMFNVGLTVWHNPQTFGDYSQNNQPQNP